MLARFNQIFPVAGYSKLDVGLLPSEAMFQALATQGQGRSCFVSDGTAVAGGGGSAVTGLAKKSRAGGAVQKDDRPLPVPELPWFNTMRTSFAAGSASTFVLHGNTRDLIPLQADSKILWCMGATEYLAASQGPKRDFVATFDMADGLKMAKDGDELDPVQALVIFNSIRASKNLPPLESLPKDVATFLSTLRAIYYTERLDDGSATIIDYLEMLVPAGDPAFMTDEARANLVLAQKIPEDPHLLSGNHVIVGVTQTLSEVNPRFVQVPHVESIKVDYPDRDMREFFLKSEIQNIKAAGAGQNLSLEMNLASLAEITAGLKLIDLRRLLRSAQTKQEKVTYAMVSCYKKIIIEKECGNLVEFVEGGHDFSAVGGMEGAKQVLSSVAEDVRKGLFDRVPMGIMFVGPMGTGKTYVAEALAKETGMTCLKLGTIRDKFVGNTEANLEKVLDLLDALGNVILFIDEADRSLSSGEDSDGGVNSRIISRLKEYMSDKKHKGRVIFIMATNRPDQIDVDLKRPGRMDLKIPFFFPETTGERKDILSRTATRHRLVFVKGVNLDLLAEKTEGYSAAELARLIENMVKLVDDKKRVVSAQILEQAFGDFIPSRDIRRLRLMELLAAFESSSKKMLPERYQGMTTEEIQTAIDTTLREIELNFSSRR